MFKLSNSIGKIGEDTACVFLMKHGFMLIDRNYWKKWGEIDIVAFKDNVYHFVEVKTVRALKGNTLGKDMLRPEENVHTWKQQRLKRVMQSYIAERGIEEGKWQFDVISVHLFVETKEARVEFLENVILF